jgi:hypothetical protein
MRGGGLGANTVDAREEEVVPGALEAAAGMEDVLALCLAWLSVRA